MIIGLHRAVLFKNLHTPCRIMYILIMMLVETAENQTQLSVQLRIGLTKNEEILDQEHFQRAPAGQKREVADVRTLNSFNVLNLEYSCTIQQAHIQTGVCEIICE